MEFSYKRILVLGLGFFAITLSWALYNAYVPIFLQRYLTSGLLVGFIMTLDNIAAITLQPYFGARSDVTQTRFGRRMPYLLVGIPLSAIFFALIPVAYLASLSLLVVAILLFNTIMSIYRAPTIALMPDITPAALRSKANGAVNLMGGLGGVLAFIGGAWLYGVDPRLPFVITAGVMLIVVFLLFKFVKEPERPAEVQKEKSMGIVEAMWFVIREKEKSALFLLGAIFFWFTGYGAVETFFTSYGKFFLGVEENSAALVLGFFSVSFLIFAIPSGLLATKIGRRKTILIGLSGLIVIFFSLIFVHNLTYIGILLLLAGSMWAGVNINSYPMIVEMTSEANIGAYTGLYYFYSSLAAIVGPILFGAVKDLVGYSALFKYSALFFLIALLAMLRVTRGEVETNPQS